MIVEYEEKYLENVRDLLVELEEYILEIDRDHLDQLHPDYREKMALYDLGELEKNEGKCFLAMDEGKVVGLIMGMIRSYEEQDYLDYTCPKSGIITELIISKKSRGKALGKQLMTKMEEYFLQKGCEYMLVDVFAYNHKAIQFYEHEGYHTRMQTMMKKIVEGEENV